MFPYFEGDPTKLLEAITKMKTAQDSHQGIQLNTDESKSMLEAMKFLLETWAESKEMNPNTISFSSEPNRFVDIVQRFSGTATLSSEDIDFFLIEYRQLLDIISLSRTGKTLEEVKTALRLQLGDEEEGE